MRQPLSGRKGTLPAHAEAPALSRQRRSGRQPAGARDGGRAHDWRRLLRAVRQGLATYGAAAVAHDQRASAAALRSRQLRPRRIAVIGSTGGVGTTTAAALLASVLAAARDDQTLLLTMHSDANDVAVRLAVPHAPSVIEVLAGLRTHGRIPPTPVTRSGLRVLSAALPGSPGVETGLAGLLDVAASGHASVVVDAGVANRIGDLATLAELFDTVVLVCATSGNAIAATNTVLARWRTQMPPHTATRLILMLVRSQADTGGPNCGAVERLLADGVAAHVMGHDRVLGRGTTIDLRTLSGPSLATALELGADIMGHR